MQRNIISVLVALAAAAGAAAQPIPDAGQISRETRERAAREPAPATPKVAQQAGSAPDDELSGPRVKVRSVRVKGATLVPTALLEAEVRRLEGTTASVGQLRAAAADITALYRERGYLLARAYLPAQDVTEGVIEIAVLEGRVGEIKVAGEAGVRLDESIAENILSAAATRGPAVRDSDLERGLLLLGELGGVNASAMLEPGVEFGSARVNVGLQPTALLDGRVAVDNHGSKSSGEWRANLEARLNGAMGRGEVVSFSGMLSEDAGLRSGGVHLALPVAPGWTVRGGISHLAYDIGGDFSALGVNGTVTDYSAGGAWAWVRNRHTRLTVSLDAARREMADRIDAFGTNNDRSITTLTARLSGTHSDDWAGGGLSGFSFGISAGDLKLDSALQRSIDQGPGGYDTEGGFQRWNAAVWRTQYLRGGLSAFASLRAQFSPAGNLDSSEKGLLGGPNGVRGFPVSEAAGDEIVQGSVELRYDSTRLPRPVRFFTFLDLGHATLRAEPNATDGENERDLSALGVGLMLKPSPRSDVNLTVARGNESSLEDVRASRTRIFVSAGWNF